MTRVILFATEASSFDKSTADGSCQLCPSECAPGGEFCPDCAADLALIAAYEALAEGPMIETGN